MGEHAAVARTQQSLVVVVAAVALACGRGVEAMRESDIIEARAAFLENIAAIHARDAERYLAQYLETPDLVALSPAGLVRGFEPLARSRRGSTIWPDTLVAEEPTLVWLGPGIVWGAYRYVAVQGGETADGWSERIFVKTADGWRIAVTGVVPGGGAN